MFVQLYVQNALLTLKLMKNYYKLRQTINTYIFLRVRDVYKSKQSDLWKQDSVKQNCLHSINIVFINAIVSSLHLAAIPPT